MSLFNGITKFFNKKEDNNILGVDIGSSSIKIVQLSRKKGVAVLDTFGEISLAVYAGKEMGQSVSLPSEKTAEALKDLMKDAQVSTKESAFAIPLKSTLIFNLKIPKNIPKVKLNEIVKVESRKYIPVPISEIQMDWSILPAITKKEQDEEKNYTILVVAIHKETLNKYNKIASIVGLNIKFLEVEIFSTIRSLIKQQRNRVAIIDIGATISKFYIVEFGIIRESHIINIGSSKMINLSKNDVKSKIGLNVLGETAKLSRENSEDLSETNRTPANLSKIANEIRKYILGYQKKNNKDVSELILTGGGVLSVKIKNYLKSKLTTEVKIGDPFSRVHNPAFLDAALKDAGSTFAVAVGIALRGLK